MSAQATGYAKKNRSKLPLIITLIVAVAAAAVLAFFVFGQGGKKEAGSGQLTISVPLEPTNLDIKQTAGVALDQVLIDNIYQGLVGFKPGTLEIEPVLAEQYTVSPDGLEYDFEVREGVKFHSGNVLTTQDVVDSLQAGLDGMATVSSPADLRIKIELAEPNSQLLFLLASRPGIIFESAATNDLSSSANGTGPFVFEEWKTGDSITLVKNDDYWGESAGVDRVVFRYIPDGKAAVNASLDGELDVQISVLPSLRAELEKDGNFTLVRADSTDVFTLAYNNAREPLDNKRVRSAISMAIDTDAIIEALAGDGKALGGPITSLEPGYADLTSVNAYDPETAKKILDEEGISGLSLTVTAPNFYDTVALDIVASQLAAVGIELKINQVEFSTWLEDVYINHDYDLSFVDHAEAFDFGNYANPDYYFGFNSIDVQGLFAESIKSATASDAAAKLSEAAKIVAGEAVGKWLYNYTPTNAIANGVKGFPEGNTNSRINLSGVTIE